MKRLILLGTAVLVLLVGGVYLVRMLVNSTDTDCYQAQMNELPERIYLGDTLKFESLTAGAGSWLWDFGDGNAAEIEKGAHVFEDYGTYTVTLTVNGNCKVEKIVEVASRNPDKQENIALIPIIEGPATAEIGKLLKFKAKADGAKNFEWSFGENGNEIDARGEEVTYTYKYAKTFNISLKTDNGSAPAYKKITVKSKPVKAGGFSEAQAKQLLNAICEDSYNSEAAPKLYSMVGGNSGIEVNVAGVDKKFDLSSYIMHLRMKRGSVKVNTVKPVIANGEVTKLNITQANN